MSNKKQNHIVDSNKMVTAVEWLFKELLNSEPNILEWNKLLEQAKAMEKEQIIDCFMDASQNFSEGEANKYYKETYEQ
jgi:hydroxymethylpyrimidine/phosphomethylpyrimidine kinase